jgi:hypothetical protein
LRSQVVLSVGIEPETVEKLKETAQKAGISVSRFVRNAIENHLALACARAPVNIPPIYINNTTLPNIRLEEDKGVKGGTGGTGGKGGTDNSVTLISKPRFVPPTVPEVRAYCEARKNGIDAEAFVAHYESKGWRIGNTPMKKWQAAVITWERRNRNERTQHGGSGADSGSDTGESRWNLKTIVC